MTENQQQRTFVLGITGGIGCGKSEVARALQQQGVPVCDTDDVAHACMAPEGPAYTAVVEKFGREILFSDGRIDRRVLGARVFADEAERLALNAIVHPEVRRAWRAWVMEQEGADWVAVVIPLLFEVGAEKDVDATLCVAAPADCVQRRLRERGWSDEEIDRRIASQWPLEEKQKRSDYVIENSDSLELLAVWVQQVLSAIRKKEQ